VAKPPPEARRTRAMKTKITALLVVGSLGLAACGTDEQPASPADEPASDASADAAVDVVDFAFEPEQTEVSVGTTVEWSYEEGSSQHTVTFDDGEESGDLEPGDAYTRTFDEPGEHPYVCFFHPSMTGTVTVTG